MGAEASHQAGDYQEPELPAGMLEVRISVYKLELTGVGFLDHIGAGLAGAYHTGLVVANEEWAYGFHDVPGKSGVYCTKPELNPDYIFYQRVILGQIRATPKEVSNMIRKIAHTEKWSGVSYDLIERNCNHFVSDTCWMLLKKRPPAWINSTAEGMALKRRRERCEESLLAGSLAAYRGEHAAREASSGRASQTASGANEGAAPVPGARAFEDTFSSTFAQRWDKGVKALAVAARECPEGEDPEAASRKAERELLATAGTAACAAARVVSAAARMATEARKSQPPGGLVAWDARWVRESAALLKGWKQQAVDGSLDPDPQSTQGAQRAARVLEALATAGEAALQAEAERARQARRPSAEAA